MTEEKLMEKGTEEENIAEENTAEENTAEESKEPSFKENLYDKIPITYRQADLIAKVSMTALVLLLAYLVITSDVWR